MRFRGVLTFVQNPREKNKWKRLGGSPNLRESNRYTIHDVSFSATLYLSLSTCVFAIAAISDKFKVSPSINEKSRKRRSTLRAKRIALDERKVADGY